MVHDLLQRKLLIGRTTEEMQKMLGEPSSCGVQRLYCGYVVKQEATGWDHVYILQLDIDPKTQKITSAQIRAD
jgi:hypothetical protein